MAAASNLVCLGLTTAIKNRLRRRPLCEWCASECELRLSLEAISLAPRDVLASPVEADEYFLATLSGPRADTGSIHILIVIPPAEERKSPTVRDALWWLAADAWAIER